MDFNNLIQILEVEIKNYSDLSNLEEEKKKALVQGDLKNLNAILANQESLVKNLQELQNQRQNFLKEWAKQHKQSNQVTLKNFIEFYEPNKTQKIKQLRQELLNIAKMIGRKNRSNETLVFQSLDHVQQLMSIISGSHETLAYEWRGQKSNLGQRVLMDQNA